MVSELNPVEHIQQISNVHFQPICSCIRHDAFVATKSRAKNCDFGTTGLADALKLEAGCRAGGLSSPLNFIQIINQLVSTLRTVTLDRFAENEDILDEEVGFDPAEADTLCQNI